MAKQLLIVRHGKSEWGNARLPDFERPLNPRGHRDAPEMAARIAHRNLIPQHVVSSTALRALTTAKHFCQVWQFPSGQIQLEDGIYEANTRTLLDIINQFDNQYDYIAVFGHNPGFTDLVNYLSDSNIYNMPTCGTALIRFDIDDWNAISGHTGTLNAFDYPKNET